MVPHFFAKIRGCFEKCPFSTKSDWLIYTSLLKSTIHLENRTVNDVFNHPGWVEYHLWVWSIMVKMYIFGGCVEKGGKIDVAIWKIHYYRFVGNVHADLGLSWFCYWTSSDPFQADFRPKKSRFFLKKWFFWFCDKSADSADNDQKMLRKVGYNQFWPESII